MCYTKLKHDVTPKDFLAFCQDKKQAVHPIWYAKCQEIANGAGLAAADYLLRSICIDTRGLANMGAPRAITILKHDKDINGIAYTSADVRKAPDLLQLAEEEFIREFRAEAKRFADLVGIKHMKQVAADVLTEFK